MDRLIELDSLFAEAALETLYIVAVTLGIGGAGGLLLGVLLYTTRAGGIAPQRAVHVGLNLLVNFFRPIPFVIFIAAAQPLARLVVGIGIGNRALIFALSLAAAFGISRIVEQNLVSVDPGVLEASRAMGAGRLRTTLTVLLPEAFGPLILGYTFAFVAIVDMAAIAGVVGGGGLGAFALTYGYRQYDPLVTWAAVLVIIAFVQLVQFGGNRAARRVMRR
ncbi:ABC transporter permease [Nocardioides sp. OK12]|uniref:D-methionine transport system permease protein n=1 Tax=Nocardioides marinisabuli TaxID=419476 RepID=A0A7Y9EYD4_9ACTN|nr:MULTISPECIES: ABC transporter permease subunit [Nocardioides]NYD56149.1 D-methionine transport system permease protein [Nocardioides marinisabuli]GHJ61099.1 ABC transporter permease [Nocardioides sp. OK12]